MSIFGKKNETHNKFALAPKSLESMGNWLYADKHEVNLLGLGPQPYKGPCTHNITKLIESMFKLTRIFKALDQFNRNKIKSYLLPYLDESQHIRCYISDSYIVVEANSDPTAYQGYKNWKHVIEKHQADEGSFNVGSLKIIPGLSDVTIGIFAEAVAIIVETGEKFLYNQLHTNSSFLDDIKKIRIGDKTKDELVEEEKIRQLALKKIALEEKQKNKSGLWFKLWNNSPKIKF